MRTLLLVALLYSQAHADERATTISIAGTGGAFERTYSDTYSETPAFGPRLTLAWEHAPVEMPPAPGYNVGADIVPELLGGTFFEPERAESYIGAGVRGELKFAQREMGLLRVSARFAAYLAVRGIVLGKDREGMGELTIGQYFLLGKGRTRLGVEGGVLVGKKEQMDYYEQRNGGAIVSVYLGWAP